MFVYDMCAYACMYSLVFDCDPFFNGSDNTHQIECIASLCSAEELLQWIDTYNIQIRNPEIERFLLGKQAASKQAASEQAASGGVPSGGVPSGGAASGGATSGGDPTRGPSVRRMRAVRGITSNDRISGSKSRGGAVRGGTSVEGTSTGGAPSEGISTGGASTGGTSNEGTPIGGAPTGGSKWHAFRSAANDHLCCDDAIDLVGKMLTIDHQVTPLSLLRPYISPSKL